MNDSSSSKAFRLCINRDDHDRLLDADKWPAYVGISDWIFKPPNVDRESNKRQKTNDQPSDQPSEPQSENVATTASSQLPTRAPSNFVSSEDTDADMDATILNGMLEDNVLVGSEFK